MIYYVSNNGNDYAEGTKEAPFRTINHAAQIAAAGDTVRVHDGVYREWVDPKNGGYNRLNRIIYEAVEGEHPIIKGSEVVTDWEKVEGTVWKKVLSNTMFGDFNPYATVLEGDWLREPSKYNVHLGDVYINGRSMFEASSMDDLYNSEIRIKGFQNSNIDFPPELIPNPETTLYKWLAEVDSENTTIYANFREYNPNNELIEINVRQRCFYPSKTGRNYITLRGFEICQAACPFVPPTSDQIAMVGPNWSRGWIIESNDLHDAKCSAISLGKDSTTGDNDFWRFRRKYSHYYQTEAAFLSAQSDWCKERIGSHIIRNNVIHDCGETGIVGHMGCAFSTIEHNHIYNIATKHEFYGAEIAGIKLHAAIDVTIVNNCIHGCTLGTWLDWQAQGARLTKNLYYDNQRDFYIEVTHGPCTVDNNLLLSPRTIQNAAHGTAFIHNILGGNMQYYSTKDRQMPYHLPHSTQVLGVAPIFSGDDRVINNILLCLDSESAKFAPMQTCYSSNVTYEEHIDKAKNTRYEHGNPPALPVWIEDNVYAKCAEHLELENGAVTADGFEANIEEKNGEWFLTLNVPSAIFSAECKHVTTERLGSPVYSEAPYENTDETDIDFLTDILGKKREKIVAGPFAGLKKGKQKIKVWAF